MIDRMRKESGLPTSLVVTSARKLDQSAQPSSGRHHNFIDTHIPKGVRKHETATPDLVAVR
jgi:hypothetical protein